MIDLEVLSPLRGNITPYAAPYVALADVLDAPLIIAERRLAGAPGVTCAVEALSSWWRRFAGRVTG